MDSHEIWYSINGSLMRHQQIDNLMLGEMSWTIIGQSAMETGTDNHVSHKMNLTDFSDPWTFPLVPK